MTSKLDGNIWGDHVMRCLIALVRDGKFPSFDAKFIGVIADYLSPWIFYLARRSFLEPDTTGAPFIIEQRFLDGAVNNYISSYSPSKISTGAFTLNLLSKQDVQAILGVNDFLRITVSLEDLLGIAHLLNNQSEQKPNEVKVGHWTFWSIKEPLLSYKNIEIKLSPSLIVELKTFTETMRSEESLMAMITRRYLKVLGSV